MSQQPYAEGRAAEALRRYVADRDPFVIEHTIQVTSFGGAGTTALCRHLLDAGVDLQPGPAQWPFKHRRVPPEAHQVPAGFRVVYLVGDPRDAVVSLFRRNYQLGHFVALHERDPDASVRQALTDLNSFVAGGVDLFELADHVARWRNHPPGYPVLIAHYDALGSHWPDIAEFLGLPPDHPPLAFRPRASDWTDQPPSIRVGLDRMYRELAELIEAMPPILVV